MNSWTPHGHCVHWDPAVLAVEIIANLTIATSYFAIPVLLLWKRRRIMNQKWARLFAAFIALCGLTHLSDVLTVWQAEWWISAGIRASTAIVSAMTAINLWLYFEDMLGGKHRQEADRDDGGP